MIAFPSSAIEKYKKDERQISVYGILYLAQQNIVDETIQTTYTQFMLNEENECKILSFNIDEKADIYYTSLPYNTMTIEVDNEKGYFTNFSQYDITTLLNNNCYVELYINEIDDKTNNNLNYRKIMTMNFDEISSSDYEKAKLSFKSCISSLKTLKLKDINYELFSKEFASESDIQDWFLHNYNIVVNNKEGTDYPFQLVYKHIKTPQDVLLSAIDGIENLLLLTTNYKNEIVYRLENTNAHEMISRDLQLENPTIKRETSYQGAIYNYNAEFGYTYQEKEYKKSITDTLEESSDSIVLTDYDYDLSDIITNDITSSEVNITVHKNSNIATAIVLDILGNIGTKYTINIEHEDLPYINVLKENTLYVGNTTKNSKQLTLKDAQMSISYYDTLFGENSLHSKIELKCIGLPYLEVGDNVTIVNKDNNTSQIVITELNLNYDGGLTMNIKGYEFEIDILFPADDLYPSDNLYPNKPIN